MSRSFIGNLCRSNVANKSGVIYICFTEKEFFFMVGVLSLHSEMRDDGIFVQLQNEIFSIPIDFLKCLSDQCVNEYLGLDLFYDSWIVELDILNFSFVRGQKTQGKEFPDGLYLGEFGHLYIGLRSY